MFNWLSYGNDPSKENAVMDRDYFLRREWSFTIEDDIYIRYQSFRDKGEMMAAIQRRQPHKIDIGAVFTASPKDHTTIKPELFKTVERELVFDIDMTDYDDIRTCCTGANICRRCWPYMTMALKVVDEALREDFNFKNILWIYSGRRGVHCWVCDPEARALPNEARSAIVEYLTVETGSAENSDKRKQHVFQVPMHPMVRRAYDTLEPFFEVCICDDKGQGLLARKDRYIKVRNALRAFVPPPGRTFQPLCRGDVGSTGAGRQAFLYPFLPDPSPLLFAPTATYPLGLTETPQFLTH